MNDVLTNAGKALLHLSDDLRTYIREPLPQAELKQRVRFYGAIVLAAWAWDGAFDLATPHLLEASSAVRLLRWIIPGFLGLFLGGQAVFGYALATLTRVRSGTTTGGLDHRREFVPTLGAALTLGLLIGLKDLLLLHPFWAAGFSVYRLLLFFAALLQTTLFHAALAITTWFAWTYAIKVGKIWLLLKTLISLQFSIWLVRMVLQQAKMANPFHWIGGGTWQPPRMNFDIFTFERTVYGNLFEPLVEICIYTVLLGLLSMHVAQRIKAQKTQNKAIPPVEPPENPPTQTAPPPPPPPIPVQATVPPPPPPIPTTPEEKPKTR